MNTDLRVEKMLKNIKFPILKKGESVTYLRNYNFGKTGEITSTVVMVKGIMALLANGDEICALKTKK